MPHFLKHFTLPEARNLLPRLRRLFQELHDLQDALRVMAPRHEASRRHADGNGGGSPDAVSYLQASGRFQEIFREISALGVQVKDLDAGLVDFPHLMDGREVFLCWRLGEDTISYWHELETGFAGRRLLSS